MTHRSEIITKAAQIVDSGAFFDELRRLVSHRTESSGASGRADVTAYLQEEIVPRLTDLGFSHELFDGWNSGPNTFLIGTRVEGAHLPTVLCYGHADVVDGHAGQWDAGRNPWTLEADGERWYGRGTADNKGQHLVNLKALELLLRENGSLGFNVTILFEGGEGIGSPDLAGFAAAHQSELAADVFIASDGPRLDANTPTIFLGARGGVGFELHVDLRPDSYHSGNWGGLLRNPATTLAGAIGVLVDGHGTIRVPELLPAAIPAAVRQALAGIEVGTADGDPTLDPSWGDASLTPAERVFGWNTLEVLALAAADPAHPVNAIPGSARAVLQLRYVVGTDVENIGRRVKDILDANGYGMVKVHLTSSFPASRVEPDNPWVHWAADSLERTTGTRTAVLPNIGGSLPNNVFEGILGLPTLWIPHSYPGCLQHAPNEHMLAPIARQGLQIAAGLFHDLGVERNSPHSATAPSTVF